MGRARLGGRGRKRLSTRGEDERSSQLHKRGGLPNFIKGKVFPTS